MKFEWPKEQEFRPRDNIPVTHDGKVIGLLEKIERTLRRWCGAKTACTTKWVFA